MKTYKVGDIVQVNLNPTVGSETKKVRPCIVITDASPLEMVIVVAVTADNGKRNTKIFVPIQSSKETGLSKDSVVDCFQLRAISSQRISKRIGEADIKTLDEIKRRLALILDIGEEHVS